MKKLLFALLAVAMLVSVCVLSAYAADPVVYVSTVSGNDANDGSSAATAKKTLGSKSGKGAVGALKNGGTMVVFERLLVGSKDTTYKFQADGPISLKRILQQAV